MAKQVVVIKKVKKSIIQEEPIKQEPIKQQPIKQKPMEAIKQQPMEPIKQQDINPIIASKLEYFGNYIYPMSYWCNHLNIPTTIVHDTWLPIYINEDTTSLYRNMLFTKYIHCKDTSCINCSCMLLMVEYT
jgi:hypothetical protein